MAPLIELEVIFHMQNGFVRPLREGKEAIKNLIFVGISSKTDTEVKIEAVCVRTTKINEDPVKIQVVLNIKTEKQEEKVRSISCTCPAGASLEHVCKHAMATLLYLERNEEEDLEKVTCTDLEQQWGKLKEATLSKFGPVPLSEYCHIGGKKSPFRRSVTPVSPESEEEFRNMFLAAEPESEAAIFESCVRVKEIQPEEVQSSCVSITTIVANATENANYIIKKAQEYGCELLTQCSLKEKDYYEKHIKILNVSDALKLCEETMGQSNEKWEEARYGRITGSVCYSLFTYTKNKKTDWEKKLCTTYESAFTDNQDTERGLMFENDALLCYKKEYNVEFAKPGFLVNALVPWFGYSADGIIIKDSVVHQVWECKTPPGNEDASIIADKVSFMSNRKLKEKHSYFGQVQLGLLVCSSKL